MRSWTGGLRVVDVQVVLMAILAVWAPNLCVVRRRGSGSDSPDCEAVENDKCVGVLCAGYIKLGERWESSLRLAIMHLPMSRLFL
jgi:hypothetical protein